jgi:hypothetical protein
MPVASIPTAGLMTRNNLWVGSCITIFRAWLAFTHVTAYTLAESP